VNRSYIATRREEGKLDVTTHFPEDEAALDYALEWCRSDGYKVIEHKFTTTKNDEKLAGTIIVTVEAKQKAQTCPHCRKPGMVEVVDGKTYYGHKQTLEFGQDTVNFGFKYCPEPPRRESLTPHDGHPTKPQA
jgi:hypothetical protein